MDDRKCNPSHQLTDETPARINDWRYRKEVDKIVTTLFSCDYHYGEPQAQDDIMDLAWFNVADLSAMKYNPAAAT